jgi:hypothetical protein
VRRLWLAAGLAVAVAVMGLAAVGLGPQAAVAATKPDSCPTNKPMVVDAYDTTKNTHDFAADGHVWALDNYTETIQMWRVGANAYCAHVHSVGSTTTFAGVSPEGTGFVPAGVTASFEGEFFVTVHGTFEPTVPTTGFIGDFDGLCDQSACAGTLPNLNLFFSKINSQRYGWYHAHFDAGACGVWDQSVEGDTGDIVC